MKTMIISTAMMLTSLLLYSQDKLKVSVQCVECDMQYLKRQLTWVDYVRDQSLSDVHIWSMEQKNGGGGMDLIIQFVGQGELEGHQFELSYQATKMQSQLEIQREIANLISIGLLPFSAKHGYMPLVKLQQDTAKASLHSADHDRWRNWVFDIGINVEVELETNQKELEVEGMMRARQVTEKWRIRTELEYDFEENSVIGDGISYESTFNRIIFEGSTVRSISDHWSAGLFVDFQNNSMRNIRFASRVNAALEYNFYPYWQSHEKEFTVAYFVGPVFMQYFEETIYGLYTENLMAQQLSIEYRLKQPWGSMDMDIDWFNYLNDLTKNRISLEVGTQIRVTKGLSLSLSGRYQMIHDQIYLPKGSASLDEILLKRKSIATDFSFDFYVGLVYTFGSIFNNIVNTRL